MLRRAENISVTYQPGLFRPGWLLLTIGKQTYRTKKLSRTEFDLLRQEEERVPVVVGRIGSRTYWSFRGRYYSDIDGLTQRQVYALLLTREERDQQRIALAEAMLVAGSRPIAQRRAIPDDVKQYVFTRDGGRCRCCGSGVELQFDHIIPLALGGNSEPDNLQVLCGPCNRRKGGGLKTGLPQVLPSVRPTPAQSQPWWKQPGFKN